MFATGVENSIPTIKGGRVRVDQMEAGGHYKHWKTDFELVEDTGIRFLRYGPPLHTAFVAPGRYDWEFADMAFAELGGATSCRSWTSATSACRTGSATSRTRTSRSCSRPTRGRFAERFPWVQLYTPVNEMYICATFSAKYGWWNEQLKSDHGFVTALKHIVKANVLAMQAILKVREDAIFIQSESSEYYHAENPAAIKPAEIQNSRASSR
jgi:hypothetical protein